MEIKRFLYAIALVSKVRWLPRTLKDLERLYGFIHEKNPNAAIKSLVFIKQSAITL
jgi:plasmid stabilization system protein ParE